MAKMMIGDILLYKGYVTEDDIEEAIEIQKKEGGLIGMILRDKDIITTSQLIEVLSEQQEKNRF